MSPLEKRIVDCIGMTGRAPLKIAEMLKEPLQNVNQAIKNLHKRKVLLQKVGGYKYWLADNK